MRAIEFLSLTFENGDPVVSTLFGTWTALSFNFPNTHLPPLHTLVLIIYST